jgi:hypothetical protein
MNIHPRRTLVLVLFLVALAGCDPSGGRVAPPSIDPVSMAQAAIHHWDANADRSLDAAELAKSPGLKRNLAVIDTNKDGKLSEDEIAARLKTFRDANVGLVGLSARFTLDGQPLEAARVVLKPEKFLSAALKPAEAVTTPEGVGFFQMSGDLPGVQPGIYRLEVYHPGSDGKESIPARYNAETIYGIDAGVDSPDVNNRTHFALTSK